MGDDEDWQGIWSGANLIDSLFMFITIILMFVFLFIRVYVPLTTTELIIWMFISESYVLGYVIVRSKMNEKHREAVRYLKFCYVGIWRDYTHYEKMLIGVKEWYQIDIKWSKDTLKELMSDSFFNSIKSDIINWQKLEDSLTPTMLPFINEIESESKEEIKRNKDINKIMEVYKKFPLKDLSDNIIKELENYNLYIAVLNEGYKYNDTEVKFDRLALIMDTKLEDTMKTKMSFAVHKGYPVSIDQVECAFVQLGWILPEIPLFILTWSENITKIVLQPALDVSQIIYIEMKTLENYVYTLRSFSQQASMALRQSQVIADKYYESWDGLLQEFEELNLNKVLGSTGANQLKAEENINKLSQYKLIIYLLIFMIGIIIFLYILSIFIPTNQPLTPLTNPFDNNTNQTTSEY